MPYKNIEDKRSCSRKRKREHKERGLCVYCSLPALKGHVTCEKHLKANRISGLKHYARRVLAFRCVGCGKPHGKLRYAALCEKCLEKNRKYKKQKRDEWRKTGRCISCGRLLNEERDGKDKTCIHCATHRQIGSMRIPKYSQYSIEMSQERVKDAIERER